MIKLMIIEWYKKAAKWTNEKKLDSAVHMIVGALIQGLFMGMWNAPWFIGILVALLIGAGKEKFIDQHFSVKDMLDYPYGAFLVYLGSLI